jgi:hypothetical protein
MAVRETIETEDCCEESRDDFSNGNVEYLNYLIKQQLPAIEVRFPHSICAHIGRLPTFVSLHNPHLPQLHMPLAERLFSAWETVFEVNGTQHES